MGPRHPDLIATFVDSTTSDIDLANDMTRQRYVPEGYALRYVVNTTRWSTGEDIIDVTGLDLPEIRGLVSRGYNYGVLARRAPHVADR